MANEYWSTLATSWIVPVCPLEVRHWFLLSSYECFGWLLFLIDPPWKSVCWYRSLHQLFLLDLLDTLLQPLQQHLVGDLEHHVWRWPLHLKHLNQPVGFEPLSSPLSAFTELKRLRAVFWEWKFYVTDPPMPRACFELGFGSEESFSRFDLLTNHKDGLHITVRILFCFCIIHVFIGTGL